MSTKPLDRSQLIGSQYGDLESAICDVLCAIELANTAKEAIVDAQSRRAANGSVSFDLSPVDREVFDYAMNEACMKAKALKEQFYAPLRDGEREPGPAAAAAGLPDWKA